MTTCKYLVLNKNTGKRAEHSLEFDCRWLAVEWANECNKYEPDSYEVVAVNFPVYGEII